MRVYLKHVFWCIVKLATPGRPSTLDSGSRQITYDSKCVIYFNLRERSKYHYFTLTLYYKSLINVYGANQSVKTK